jgi:hypothetical protein
MQANEVIVSVGILRRADVDNVIAGFEKDLYREYRTEFNKLADNTKEVGPEELHAVWCLLTSVTSMQLRPSNTREPFGPMFVLEDCRSAIPEDLTEESLDALAEWMPEIQDSELKARIADLLWFRRRRPEYARTAIAAYMDTARQIEDAEHWPPCAERIERALRMSAMLRRNTPEDYNMIIEYIESVLDKYAGDDPKFLSVKLLDLLADFGHDNPDKYFHLAVGIAERARGTADWHKAEQAWEVADKWAALLKDDERRNSVLISWAETYSEQAQSGDSGLGSSMWMQKSIELYKRVPNSRERRDELYQILRQFQKDSRDQMTLIEGPEIDLSESVNESRKAVSGKTFEDALFNLAFRVARPPKFEEIKKQAKENMEKFVLSRMFGAVHMDRDGLVVASVPASLGVGDDGEAKALWAQMLQNVQIHHNLDVQGAIEPARREINLEHHATEDMIYRYIQNNPFIPNGFEYLYAKGLHAGLVGDFIVATHLLVPQLENCLRHVLHQVGVETTTLNTHGLQERLRIGTILDHPKLAETLGKDAVMDLQSLLIERKYGNLRNEISHGLMPANHFFQPSVVYLWWMALRLCLIPFLKSWNEMGSGIHADVVEDTEENLS